MSTPHPLAYDGLRLFYDTHGDPSDPPVVYLHGLQMDSRMNQPLAQTLSAAGYYVVLLDLAGHGRSSRPTSSGPHRVESMADSVIALLDHLSIDQAVIGGVSLGAGVALTVASNHPKRTKGIICEMPVAERGAVVGAALFMAQFAASRLLRYPLALGTRAARLLPCTGFGPFDSAISVLQRNPSHTAALLHGVMLGAVVPPPHARKTLEPPVLVLGHRYDPLHSYQDAIRIADQAPRSTFIEVPSPLALRITGPTGPTVHIREWLDSLHATSKTG